MIAPVVGGCGFAMVGLPDDGAAQEVAGRIVGRFGPRIAMADSAVERPPFSGQFRLVKMTMDIDEVLLGKVMKAHGCASKAS